MNTFKYICLLLLTTNAVLAHAQKKDTTAIFRVAGVCGQCERRIEKALALNGVTSAQWDAATGQATVTYNPAQVKLFRLHEAAAAAGHDTEEKKADDEVYKALPECCLYREMNHEKEMDAADSTRFLKGIVVQQKKGEKHPLAGASIVWLGTEEGTRSNEHGEFLLHRDSSDNKVVISYAGFRTDTVSVAGMHDILITLSEKDDLSAIVITTRQRTSYIDSYNPFRTAIMTKKELLKAACCNLSESFETNPSVDVSYNDAATGSRQIQLLGLSGIYTQLTVENLPGPRGLATPLGLNSIAGPWVESIQLIKGTGSVVNGFESIAGQINIELRKPDEMEKLYLNGYVNSMAKTDVNLNWAHKINSRWSTGLLLHDDFLYTKQDFNGDMFRDLPTGNQFSGISRWHYLGEKGLMSDFGVKLLLDSKTGGVRDFDPDRHKYSTHHYGLGIDTRRMEAFAKVGYVFPEKMYQSIGLQLSAIDHDQQAYFGVTDYDARQKNLYGNLIFQTRLGSEAHTFKTGLSITSDQFREELKGRAYQRNETVPGAFAEYTFTPSSKLDIVAGIRADRNSLYGWFGTPRLNIRYAPVTGTTLRLSVGRGQRTANIFAENLGVLVSARQVVLDNGGNQTGAYGLHPEVAWNKGISLDQRFRLFKRDASMGIDFYRNDFKNQVVLDLENPRLARFSDLDGRSFSNSLQWELSMIPAVKFDVRLAYRYFDVRTTYGGQLLQKPLTAAHRAFANLAYDLKGWKLDYTLNFIGQKRIPSTAANPEIYRLDNRSPSYVLMNAQVSRSFGKKKLFDAYIGGENLGHFFQKNAILAADQPFGNYFDASLVWGPVTGRNVYVGFRYSLK